MSYSSRQAIDERQTEIFEALRTRDSEALYHLASMEKEEGNDEVAEELLQQAKKIDREDWSYDEAKDNELQDNLN